MENNNNSSSGGESRKDISSRNMQHLGQMLEKLEFHERMMRNGCEDILEYMQQLKLNPNEFPKIQIKNAEMFITELDMLLSNIKSIIKEIDYDKMRGRLNLVTRLYNEELKDKEGKEIKISRIIINQRDKENKTVLTPWFNKMSRDLSEIRAMLIESLAGILYSLKKDEDTSKER